MFHPLSIDTLDSAVAGEKNVVLLDTARPAEGQRYSLLFVRPSRIYRCFDGGKIETFLDLISATSRTRWVAGYIAYEAAYWLEEKLGALRRRRPPGGGDFAWFGVFDEPYVFDHFTGRWNRPPAAPLSTAVTASPRNEKPPVAVSRRISRCGYFAALHRIRKYIAAGDVYQVNFTYDVSVSSPLPAWELYKELRKNQPVPFGAFIRTHETTVASFSPELFFSRQGSCIRVKPMKGTAPRGRLDEEDRVRERALADDLKNRSENIMIVDLLRNDLGRICVPGTVAVQRMFEVERHPTVFQMTSTVEGRVRRGTTLADTIRALFPSGSVTGAPKIRAMEIIGELERGTRCVYCGTIGYSSPEGKPAAGQVPRQVFSVPIRTLQKDDGRKTWRYRVGSGVVWDSSPADEWQECRDKCGFLTERRPDFRLFESLLFTKGIFLHYREHRERLLDSARYFGFSATRKDWDLAARSIRKKLGPAGGCAFKVRIFSDRDGTFSWDHEPVPAPESRRPATIRLCRTAIDPANSFLFHKTTFRRWYEKSMHDIRRKSCFDVLHVNTRGELTEGARSNLFLSIKGALYTPPVRCGLLPGVLRGKLLTAGKCREKTLYPEDLAKAEAVFCGNSVRGLVKVVIVA
ncbi:MAG: aminodeoxychorismate synthase component I [Chitinispirillaceae bacterium]|nr:aminodeoxychorismate synthase component I [Chitinispirillaceae bacterium]